MHGVTSGNTTSWSSIVLAFVTYSSFSGVWGSASSDVWAVGCDIVVRFDGMAWTRQAPMCLRGIWGTSKDNVWSVGAGIFHWNGIAWSETLLRVIQYKDLNRVWGTSESDIWAVGKDGTTLHYSQ